eukprot:1158060-Pelagomonas_calceolata.AAC.4
MVASVNGSAHLGLRKFVSQRQQGKKPTRSFSINYSYRAQASTHVVLSFFPINTAGSIPGSIFKRPFICPMDHVFEIENGWFPDRPYGFPEDQVGPKVRVCAGWRMQRVEWREYSFLENPALPKSVSQSRLKVEVSFIHHMPRLCAGLGDSYGLCAGLETSYGARAEGIHVRNSYAPSQLCDCIPLPPATDKGRHFACLLSTDTERPLQR